MYVWHRMGIELHVVPSHLITDPRIHTYVSSLATIHPVEDFGAFSGIPVISFCKKEFLINAGKLKGMASATIWVNCMTWTFLKERRAHRKGFIDLHIYQTKHGMSKITAKLRKDNSKLNYAMVTPYFNSEKFPYIEDRDESIFCFGRISRDDVAKIMPSTLQIYETINSPKTKKAIILGIQKQKNHLGDVNQDWINLYPPSGISQQEFYKACDAIVQTSDCYENWPRVGLEAMASGSVLIVYKNDGWSGQIIHGETGYLCNSPRDFAFYASHLAHHPEIRNKIAKNAKEHLEELAGFEASSKSWELAFNKLG